MCQQEVGLGLAGTDALPCMSCELLESETLQSLNVCFHFLATDMQIQRPPEQQEFGQPG